MAVHKTLEVIFDVEEVQESHSNTCEDQQYEVDNGEDVAPESCPPTRPGTLVISSIVVVLCL